MIWPALSDTQSALTRSGAKPALPQMLGLQARDQVRINEEYFGDAGLLANSAEPVRQTALRALLDDPLDAMTLRQLAYTLSGANRPITVPLLKLADRASRRDFLTQISLIEFEVQSISADRALRHYDRTLSVYPEMSETLFPILAKAANEPDVQRGLDAYISRPWFRSFLAMALKQGARPETVAAFFKKSGFGLQSDNDRQLRLQLLDQLLAMGAIDAAAQMVREATPTTDRLLRDLSFDMQTADPALGPFAWRLSHGEPVTAILADAGWLDVQISSGRSGLIAERVTLLPSGRFARTLKVQSGKDQALARISVEVQCLGIGDGNSLASRDMLPHASEAEITLLIPEGCRAQTWRIKGFGVFGKGSVEVRLGWAAAEK